MRMSQRFVDSEREARRSRNASHELLLRAGMIAKLAAGIYVTCLLPGAA